jgi:hypothetical protein
MLGVIAGLGTQRARVRILSGQPGSSVSGLYFPQNGRASTLPRVRLAGASLWRAISGISVLWARVSGAGLCSAFSNFRFGGAEIGSSVDGDRFEARSREAIAPSESKAEELTAAKNESEPPLLLYLFHQIVGAAIMRAVLTQGGTRYAALGSAIFLCVSGSVVVAHFVELPMRTVLRRALFWLAGWPLWNWLALRAPKIRDA